MSRHTDLQDHELPAYDEALKCRGSLKIWLDPGMAWVAQPTGKRGRQPAYNDAAGQTCQSIYTLFGMALQQPVFVEG